MPISSEITLTVLKKTPKNPKTPKNAPRDTKLGYIESPHMVLNICLYLRKPKNAPK